MTHQEEIHRVWKAALNHLQQKAEEDRPIAKYYAQLELELVDPNENEEKYGRDRVWSIRLSDEGNHETWDQDDLPILGGVIERIDEWAETPYYDSVRLADQRREEEKREEVDEE